MVRARAWLVQAESDLVAGEHLASLSRNDPRLYCQAIAKFQQTAEKSIKAMFDAWNHSQADFRHDHAAERYISALIRIHVTPHRKDVLNHIRKLFPPSIREDVRTFDSLAPKWRAPGQLFLRNTEYPYQEPDGAWRAPAASGSFAWGEVERLGKSAKRLVVGSRQIIVSLERLGP